MPIGKSIRTECLEALKKRFRSNHNDIGAFQQEMERSDGRLTWMIRYYDRGDDAIDFSRVEYDFREYLRETL